MSRGKKKYRLKRWIVIPDWEMMESDAFWKLTAIQQRVLMRFYQKRKSEKKRRPGTSEYYWHHYNDGLAFPYAEAEYLGISKASFHRAIINLVRLGFIDIIYQGGQHRRDYSRYKITARWKRYGTDSFKERKKPRVLPPGFDVQSRKRRAECKKEKPRLRLVIRSK
jgi:hypothetical protein